jgi:hypothetical protein
MKLNDTFESELLNNPYDQIRALKKELQESKNREEALFAILNSLRLQINNAFKGGNINPEYFKTITYTEEQSKAHNKLFTLFLE